jgi:hypothetical protein
VNVIIFRVHHEGSSIQKTSIPEGRIILWTLTPCVMSPRGLYCVVRRVVEVFHFMKTMEIVHSFRLLKEADLLMIDRYKVITGWAGGIISTNPIL